MKIEQQLKEYILTRYRSVREFTMSADIPYTTLDSIFKRGIDNSSITKVFRICKALGISADELAEGRITPVSMLPHVKRGDTHEIHEFLNRFKMELISMDNPTLDGEPVDEGTLEAIAQGIDVSYETVVRYNKNHNKTHNKN